jgi:hypothetical protein
MSKARFACGCDRTILDEVLLENVDELCLSEPTKFPIQFPCLVGGVNLTARKHFLLFCYCGNHIVISCYTIVSI